ncbi:MAG: biosynthetic arginine decarboxylase [Candidatus Bruticola sp.]
MYSADWNIDKSDELYSIKRWGAPYFSINSTGHLVVSPQGERGGSIDLYSLIEALKGRGLGLPILLRFPDILQDRIERLSSAFSRAIAKYNYAGVYRGVFPVKVNQQRHIIEELVKCGQPHKFGLEAGSKPELLIALSAMDSKECLITCNGYKDSEYLETAILASKLGKKVIIILEQLDEVCLAVRTAKALNLPASFGFRVKLNRKSQGHWGNSVGERAKFGMSAYEIYQAVQILISHNMLDTLKLLHFHIGSQISAISVIKGALREAGRIYAELVKLGAPMGYLDVGGGLAVDYDGSKSDFYASKNYNMQSYANDVVAEINDACRLASIQPPTIISESGRALASHQSVLVFDVVGQSKVGNFKIPAPDGEEDYIIKTLREIYEGITLENAQESFHDAVQFKDEAMSAFQLGILSLRQRTLAEKLYWQSCRRIYEVLRASSGNASDDFFTLEKLLSTTYYVNLSVFQSAPDSWALDQLFPILPIHRLDTAPDEKVTLADLTCDSDGKIDKFIDIKEDVSPLLDVHSLRFGQEVNMYGTEEDGQAAERLSHEPYYLGMFLVGAYQETMGNLHNLFGDTNAVQVKLTPSGYKLEHIVRGDTMSKVLSYFQYNPDDLLERMRQQCEEALSNNALTLEMSQKLLNNFESSLARYTYMS